MKCLGWHLGLFFGVALCATSAWTQTGPEPSSKTQTNKTDPRTGADEPWTPPTQKEFSAEQRKAECRKYEGQYIGYYGHIYHVENCRRREIVDEDQIRHVMSSVKRVISVENDTVIMLAEGEPLNQVPGAGSGKRSCRELNGEYVISGASEIYYVEGCKRRPFPDWETYVAHRKDHMKNKVNVLELKPEEFNAIAMGNEVPSVLDQAFKSLLEGSAEVDVIPVDEACKGVDGRFVSYYSRLYKIEKCRKREISASEFLRKKDNAKMKFVELSSEQWLSLPDGKPYR